MSPQRAETVSRPLEALRRLAGDPWLRLAAGLFALEVLAFAFAGAATRLLLSTWTPVLFLAILVLLYARTARRTRDREERRFWTELTLAFCVLLANWALLYLVLEEVVSGPGAGLTQATIFSVAYLLQLMAAERRPHLSNAWRPRGLERALILPALGVFFLGLVAYFVLVPYLLDPAELPRQIPPVILYVVFDGLLALRFLFLSRTAEALRWRLVYASYGVAALLFLASNATEWTLFRATRWDHFGWAGAFLWSLPYVALAVPPCLARLRYAARSEQPGLIDPWHGALFGSSQVTLLWALLFPLVHVGLYQLGLLDDPGRTVRELVVLVSVVFLGLVALLQQKVLEEKSRDLWTERDEVEKELRTSENDLRLMVERTRAADRVAREEEKFTRAFRASHDGLAISTLDGGILVDVNASFEELTGYSRDELIGRPAPEDSFWPSSDDRKQVVSALMRDGHLRQIEAMIKVKGGAERQMVVSFELLYDSEEHYMLTVLRDVTEDRRLEKALRSQAALLDDARAPIFGIDSDGSVEYRNPAARRLLQDADAPAETGDEVHALARSRELEIYAATIREGGRVLVLVPAGEDAGDDVEDRKNVEDSDNRVNGDQSARV